MFCLGPGGAEVARVNRSFDTNRPVPGNWPIKSPEHALNGVWPAVWRSCPQIIESLKIIYTRRV